MPEIIHSVTSGILLPLRAALPQMMARGGGSMTCIASDPFGRQASAFRPGKDRPAPVSQGFALASWQEEVLAQVGVSCCSMYWRTTEMGAPPQEAAK